MTAIPEIPAGLSPYNTAQLLRSWTLSANGYSKTRKERFRLLSSGTKMLSLLMLGAATIILGLQNLSFWAGLGFSLVALTTAINAVEPFLNSRPTLPLPADAQPPLYPLPLELP